MKLPPSESRLLAEEMVRPFSALVPLILWVVAIVATGSTVSSFCKPLPDFVPDWMRILDGATDIFAVILVPLVTLILATAFTVIFFMFRGVHYRIFTDRIEYQRGKHLHLVPFQKMSFGGWQTLSFNELEAICWQIQGIGDENPPDTTFIEFRFASCTFQTHVCFDLSGKVADACRSIERDTIAPQMLLSLEKTITFKCHDNSSREIQIDNENIHIWNQNRLAYDETISWNKINTIRFSRGKMSGTGNFLAQSRIHLEDTLGKTVEFDMPRHNPHAFWAMIKDRCSLPTLQVLDFPKKENKFDLA